MEQTWAEPDKSDNIESLKIEKLRNTQKGRKDRYFGKYSG